MPRVPGDSRRDTLRARSATIRPQTEVGAAKYHLLVTAPSGRRSFNLRTARYQEYDLEGPVQPELSWLPISYDPATGQGCYAMRMQPGAVTIAHDHTAMEEFLILEGDLIDSDGTVFGPGDFVSYEAGTHHNSRTVNGCLIAVFEWQEPVA
jgi:mannose-6-phosphate isomerase-like protein (cupin superfamily)